MIMMIMIVTVVMMGDDDKSAGGGDNDDDGDDEIASFPQLMSYRDEIETRNRVMMMMMKGMKMMVTRVTW